MDPSDEGILTGVCVLLVEDEYLLAQDMARAFRDGGMQVVGPFASLADSFHALAGAPSVDLAVVDLNLRGESGLALAEELRDRGVPVIFATGYDREFLPAGFDGAPLWQKPFSAQLLVESASKLLAARPGRPDGRPNASAAET